MLPLEEDICPISPRQHYSRRCKDAGQPNIAQADTWAEKGNVVSYGIKMEYAHHEKEEILHWQNTMNIVDIIIKWKQVREKTDLCSLMKSKNVELQNKIDGWLSGA